MTSDTAQQETQPATKPETFRSHLPAIVAATTGTVLAAILGSTIGTAGTIAGMVIGSLASGTCSWWAERGIRRSAALATARAEALRARGYHVPSHEDAAATQTAVATRDTTVTKEAPATQGATVTQDTAACSPAAAGRHGRSRSRSRWAGPAAFIAAGFIGCALAVTLLEGAAGKPLSAVVQGKPGHGTTLGGGGVGKAAKVTPSPTPSASKTGPATTAPASSATPSGASSSPAASPTAPAATAPATTPGSASPVSSTPTSATPSATPTATATG